MSLFDELKRRNVFRVTIAYVIVAWLVMQIADVVLNNITAPDWVFQVLMLFLAVGLPIAVISAWAFEMTPEGLKREHERVPPWRFRQLMILMASLKAFWWWKRPGHPFGCFSPLFSRGLGCLS